MDQLGSGTVTSTPLHSTRAQAQLHLTAQGVWGGGSDERSHVPSWSKWTLVNS